MTISVRILRILNEHETWNVLNTNRSAKTVQHTVWCNDYDMIHAQISLYLLPH